MKHPFVDTRRRFTYGDYGTPDSYPELTAHTGQMVTVIRQLTNRECDPECQPMFEFRADDGFTGTANAAELDGTVRPLRPQDYQFAVPAGTGHRYLTTAEIDSVLASQKPRPFAVTVNYQTPSGNGNSYCVTVQAVDEDSAIDKANAMARRHRRVLKIDGGDCCEVSP